MSDVAKEAGVSRQAIYLYFPSRSDLLIHTTRYIDEIEDVAGQLGHVFDADEGQVRLERFVYAWGNYIPVVYGGAKRLMEIREEDEDAAAAWQDRMVGLYGACERIVETLDDQDQLAQDLTKTEATDLMWAGVSIRQWELLRLERKLSQDRYLELTHRSLVRTLVS